MGCLTAPDPGICYGEGGRFYQRGGGFTRGAAMYAKLFERGGGGGGGGPVHFRSDIQKVGGGGGQSTFGTQKIHYR